MKLTHIHSDNRGSIFSLSEDLLNFEEVAVFKTNKNYARGGCIHNLNGEYVCVLEGSIKYTYMLNGTVEEKVLNVGDTLYLPKSTPHYFVSLTDSTVMEWGATEIEKKEKHKIFRQIVDAINAKLEKKD